MNPDTGTDGRVAAWLDEEFPQQAPAALLDRVLDSTGRRRPRPVWLARRTGHHLPANPSTPGMFRLRKDRPMNRTLAFVAGIAAIAIAAVVGLGTLLPRNQPGVGATGGTTAASGSPRPGAHLGPLAAGAYAALKFEPGLLFEVPAGWMVVADDASTLILRGPGTASTYCPTDQPSSCRHVENVIDVTANRLLGSDASDCEGLARQDSPRTASEMVAALSSDPRLSTSSGRPVTIGGLTGTALTVQLHSSWTGTCKWSAGAPAALVLTAADPPGPFFGLMGPEVVDLVLLDSSDGVISLTSDPFYRTASQPIVRTFVFGGR